MLEKLANSLVSSLIDYKLEQAKSKNFICIKSPLRDALNKFNCDKSSENETSTLNNETKKRTTCKKYGCENNNRHSNFCYKCSKCFCNRHCKTFTYCLNCRIDK
jgi:hypothetical protein